MESVWNHLVISYFFPQYICHNQFSHNCFFLVTIEHENIDYLFFFQWILTKYITFIFFFVTEEYENSCSLFFSCMHKLFEKKPNSFGGYVLNSNKKRITICMYKTVVSDYNFRDLWLLLMIINISIKEVPLKRQYSWKPMS